MKFITEDEVRKSYKEAPFTNYRNQEGIRLTPGARQFLNDRGIRIEDEQEIKKSNQSPTVKEVPEGKENSAWKGTIRTIAAVILMTGQELLAADVLTAQELFGLERYLTALVKEDETMERPVCNPCTGIKAEDFTMDLEDCFEITGFHVQTPKGKEIIKLHYLRCLLKEQEPALPQRCKEGLYLIINRLSQLICQALGGTVCQKKQAKEA